MKKRNMKKLIPTKDFDFQLAMLYSSDGECYGYKNLTTGETTLTKDRQGPNKLRQTGLRRLKRFMINSNGKSLKDRFRKLVNIINFKEETTYQAYVDVKNITKDPDCRTLDLDKNIFTLRRETDIAGNKVRIYEDGEGLVLLLFYYNIDLSKYQVRNMLFYRDTVIDNEKMIGLIEEVRNLLINKTNL